MLITESEHRGHSLLSLLDYQPLTERRRSTFITALTHTPTHTRSHTVSWSVSVFAEWIRPWWQQIRSRSLSSNGWHLNKNSKLIFQERNNYKQNKDKGRVSAEEILHASPPLFNLIKDWFSTHGSDPDACQRSGGVNVGSLDKDSKCPVMSSLNNSHETSLLWRAENHSRPEVDHNTLPLYLFMGLNHFTLFMWHKCKCLLTLWFRSYSNRNQNVGKP